MVSGAFLFILLFFVGMDVLRGQPGGMNGVVIFKDHPESPPHLAYAFPFRKVEVHKWVVNATSQDGEEKRQFLKNRVVSVVKFRDVSVGDIVRREQKEAIHLEREKLESLSRTYKNTSAVLHPRIGQLKRVEELLGQGLVYSNGRWMSGEEFNKLVAMPAAGANPGRGAGGFEVDGVQYAGVRLVGADRDSVRIFHSSGAASIPKDALTEEQVEFLRSTNPAVPIAFQEASRPAKPESTMVAKAETGNDAAPVSMPRETAGGQTLPDLAVDEKVGERLEELLPAILEAQTAAAGDEWMPFPDGLHRALEEIQVGIVGAGSPQGAASLFDSRRKSQHFLRALLSFHNGAKQWQEGDGRAASEIISGVVFPTDFTATGLFEESWKAMAALQADLERREEAFLTEAAQIEKAMKEGNRNSAQLLKEITAALGEFPDKKLERLRASMAKNSLGL